MTVQVPDQFHQNKLWRYLSLGRFLWLIQNQALWLARGDLLGDPWEGALSQSQLEGLIRRERSDSNSPYNDALTARHDLSMIGIRIQRSFHANCWIDSPHESFAMWRSYCRTSESIAVQTTVGRLRDSIDRAAELVPVRYAMDEARPVTTLNVATLKRPMFASENEVRILYLSDSWMSSSWVNPPLERRMPWNATEHLEEIRLHPEANATFAAVVRAAVSAVSPQLTERISPSEMAPSPWARYFDGL